MFARPKSVLNERRKFEAPLHSPFIEFHASPGDWLPDNHIVPKKVPRHPRNCTPLLSLPPLRGNDGSGRIRGLLRENVGGVDLDVFAFAGANGPLLVAAAGDFAEHHGTVFQAN